METKNNNSAKSFYYKHTTGMMFDSSNGMMRFSYKLGAEGVALYAMTLEHLTSTENTTTVAELEHFLESLMIFDDMDVVSMIESCPDLVIEGDSIYSTYLSESLRRKNQVNLVKSQKGGFGRLVANLNKWIDRKEFDKIANNLNTCLENAKTNENVIEYIYNSDASLEALYNADFKSGLHPIELNKETIERLIEVTKRVKR